MPSILTTLSESTEYTSHDKPKTKQLSPTKPVFSMFALNLDLTNQILDQCSLTKNLTNSTTTLEAFPVSSKTPTDSTHQLFITKPLHKTEYLSTSKQQESRTLKTKEENRSQLPTKDAQRAEVSSKISVQSPATFCVQPSLNMFEDQPISG
ncbi:hypothetical protein G9A89_013529 [Geosiphon pyriformis]|nr:hypothetical protein G9A89_013529 [Geosiphon pyriformis]